MMRYIGDENTYSLFWVHTFDDIKQNRVTIEGGNQIEIFYLAGNPAKKHMLDRYITGFYINESRHLLIGLDINSDQPIVAYDLKNK